MKKVKWGILGAGGIADRRTLPGMLDCEFSEIFAVMEIDPQNAERCRQQQLGEGWFATLADVPEKAISMTAADSPLPSYHFGCSLCC